MYMGFMKMGLSLMLGFLILAAVVGYTGLGVLAVFPVAMYIYSFFHANNLSSLDDVTFHNIKDQYLFGFDNIDQMKLKLEGRNRKIAAGILIVLGVMMLWQVIFNLLCDIFGWDNRFLSAVYYFVRDELPRIVVGIAVIWAGLALIRGKRIGIEEETADGHDWQPYREHSAADGQQFRTGQPAAGEQPGKEVQHAVDRSVIYAQGPVAGEQNTAGDRNWSDQ